jgi:hypothetical protein
MAMSTLYIAWWYTHRVVWLFAQEGYAIRTGGVCYSHRRGMLFALEGYAIRTGGGYSKYGNVKAFKHLSFNDIIINTFSNKLGEKILTSTSLSKMCQVTAVYYSVPLQILSVAKLIVKIAPDNFLLHPPPKFGAFGFWDLAPPTLIGTM